MKKTWFWVICFFYAFLPCVVLAQAAPELSSEGSSQLSERSPIELYLSFGILGFGLIVLAFQLALLLKAGKWESTSIQMFGLTLIIIAGVFLITAGYSQDQITPMVGLLGTIAGYLLGKSGNNS